MGFSNEPVQIGRTIAGKYTIESRIGGGAMGEVYRARQLSLDKIVAVKVLHRDFAHDKRFITRFEREARLASRLDHPGSIRVLDFGQEPDGLLYMAMDHVDGRDLLRLLVDEDPLPTRRIVGILQQVLAVVAAAHDIGIIHRDMKPENILVTTERGDDGEVRDVVKVCDFGIAQITNGGDRDPSSMLTTQGLVVGTPAYMSPEQARGRALDARSDLYSIGIVLYQMLTGRVPFDADAPIDVVLKQVSEEPAPPSSVRPRIDLRLEAICLRALRKRPEDRFDSARAMRAALHALSDGVALISQSEPTLPEVDSSPDLAAASISERRRLSTPSEAPVARATGSTARAPRTRYAFAAALVAAVCAGSLVADRMAPHENTHLASPQTIAAGEHTPHVAPPSAPEGVVPAPVTITAGLSAPAIPTASALPSSESLVDTTVRPVSLMTTRPAARMATGTTHPHGGAASGDSRADAHNDGARPTSYDDAQGSNGGGGGGQGANGAAPSSGIGSSAANAGGTGAPAAATLAGGGAASSTREDRGAAGHAPSAPTNGFPAATTPSSNGSAPGAIPSLVATSTPFSPDHARIDIGAIETTHGVAASKLKVVLSHAQPGLVRCYRDALATRRSPAGGSATLQLSMDDGGRITVATLLTSAPLPPALGGCVSAVLRNARVQDVDTGEATAEVHLELRPD